jgi:regulatory protein
LRRPGATDVRAAALRLLARREYARAELELRLARRGAEPADIARVLDSLERDGYLSDARYAQALVAQRAGHLGQRAIARDLRERGIASDDAKAALSPLAERDEIADATALWQRRFGQPPADERERARQVRFLVSRGFSAATAFRVLRAAGARTDDLQE